MKSAIFSIVALCLFGTGLWFGFESLSLAMTFAFLGGLAFLFFGHLDRISEFRADKSGFEAKTRKLDRTVSNAQEAIKELRSLAKIVGHVTLSLAVRSGRFGGYSVEEVESLKRSILSVYDELGLGEGEKAEALGDYHRFTRFDYVYSILGDSSGTMYFPDELHAERRTLIELSEDPKCTPETLRNFLEKAGKLSREVIELIGDYEHFCNTGEHRRTELFLMRREWGKKFLSD